MTDIIRTHDHPDFVRSERVTRPRDPDPVGRALAGINDALQGERADKRAAHIWEMWAQTCDFTNVTDEDAVWFLANGSDWEEAFESAAGPWPRADWNDDEPALTVDVIADLASYYEHRRALSASDLTTVNLRAERDAWIAWRGLTERYARTRDADMGWTR